jgi:magnesium transporter
MWRALFSDRGGPVKVLQKREEVAEAAALRRGALWVDFRSPAPDEVLMLSDIFKLDPLAVEDIVAEIHHPKADDYGDYLYLAVHGIWPGAKRGDMRTCELDIVLSDHWLITHGPEEMRSVPEIWARTVKAGAFPGGTTGETLQAILATQASHHVDEVERLQEELALVETELLESKPGHKVPSKRVYLIKADLARLRIILGAQREIVHRLGRGEFRTIPARLHMHFRDVYDDLYRAAEMTDLLRDMANSALETYLNLAANRTNEIVKVLTLISCFILPMTLVTGWFGMNFHHLTGIDWRHGQLAVLGMFTAVTAVMAVFFRRKGWL